MATLTSTTNVSSLVINKVDTKTTFQNMLTNNQVNENELYFIPSTVNEDSEIFNINFILTTITPNIDITQATYSISCDKTYNEIVNAITNNYSLNIVLTMDNSEKVNFIYSYSSYENILVFHSIIKFNNTYYFVTIWYQSNGTLTYAFVPVQSQQSNATLTIGPYTYNGTTAVTIPIYDGLYNATQQET